MNSIVFTSIFKQKVVSVVLQNRFGFGNQEQKDLNFASVMLRSSRLSCIAS